MRFWVNEDGVFEERALPSGLNDTDSGKGLLTLDYDRDGDQDVLVVNNGGQPVLYRNDYRGGNAHLVVELEGALSSRDGVGATVVVDPDAEVIGDELIREIDAGTHSLGQSETIAHFGLGSEVTAIDRVSIYGPSGLVNHLDQVATNQRLVVTEVIPDPTGSLLLAFGSLLTAGRRLQWA